MAPLIGFISILCAPFRSYAGSQDQFLSRVQVQTIFQDDFVPLQIFIYLFINQNRRWSLSTNKQIIELQ